jgi:hypothetical protein
MYIIFRNFRSILLAKRDARIAATSCGQMDVSFSRQWQVIISGTLRYEDYRIVICNANDEKKSNLCLTR